MITLVPNRMFFTSGVGYHRDHLQSFELALRDAGIEKCNIVTVSSIFPPDCTLISKEQGIKELMAGQITFTVMARKSTNEPSRLVSAAIGLAQPKNSKQYGYISEHTAYGEETRQSVDFAEDLAATMLASTLGIELNPQWRDTKITSGQRWLPVPYFCLTKTVTQTRFLGHFCLTRLIPPFRFIRIIP